MRAYVAVCGDTADALDGCPAVDHDGCERWRDVCGVVGGRVVQMVRELTAHVCVCEREYGVCVVWWGFGGWEWALVFAVCVCGYGCV